MPSRGWDPDIDTDTTPAQIEREALNELHLLDGERILRVWRTARGFLVMTNLRCTDIMRKPQVFAPSDWEAGPSLFFYNLGPPRVEFRRFLRLTEEHEGRALVLRFYLHDPDEVAREIDAARVDGQREWMRRRALSEAVVRQARERWQAALEYFGRGGPRPVIRVRCGYCGNLIEASAQRCPFCGAPQSA